ncbi:branched-chain amino acid ABC transporter permease [Rhodospirillaceae bacterium SYSU D60014]|uniref:ABC transporter permease subunit n=1 Tax=Virgifigura deserti TaxID=2268457 RepID=UPI000E663E43
MGVNIFRVKIIAFMITAAVAGLAGAFYANYVGVLAPSMLSMNEMGLIVAMAVVGGLGHRYGALVGVIAIRLIEHVIRGFGAEYTLVTIAALTLFVVLFFREELIAACERLVHRIIPARSRWSDAGREPQNPNNRPGGVADAGVVNR